MRKFAVALVVCVLLALFAVAPVQACPPPPVDGKDGADGVGITNITDNGDGTFTIYLSDNTSYIITLPQAVPGVDGVNGVDGVGIDGTNGINGIDGVGTPGAQGLAGIGISSMIVDGDSLIITLTDGAVYTYTVTPEILETTTVDHGLSPWYWLGVGLSWLAVLVVGVVCFVIGRRSMKMA